MTSQPVNKIHVNNSTNISLNDRFTVMQSIGIKNTPSPHRQVRARSRSRSIGREQTAPPVVPKASFRNRQLLDQLEKRHILQAALKLKRKSLRTNLSVKQRLAIARPQRQNRIALKRVAKTLSVSPKGRLIRANSLSNVATMKADLVGPSANMLRKRSNSVSNIAARLGGTSGGIGNRGRRGRTMLRRNQQQNVLLKRTNSANNLRRSNSRQNLSRTNSQTNLSRSNSQNNLNRSNSRTNLNRLNTQSRGRRSVRQQQQMQQGAAALRRINRSNFNVRQRSASVNSRLGTNKTAVPVVRGGGRGRRTRVFHRRNSTANGDGNARHIIGGNNQTINRGNINRNRIARGGISKQQRLGRAPNRVGANRGGPGRSRSRNRQDSQQQQRGGNRIANSSNRRGGGRGRSRGRGGRGANSERPKSKEQLDQELEQYMANTKSSLDSEMDEYMRGASS